jgi:asparagine synthase (glutamine-hydrolysing)
MCGICGKVFHDPGEKVAADLVQRMMDVISHRGPDGEGKYVHGPVGLGHRRLAIIDLNTGAQPMCNEDKTVWIVFNGEIYNYQDLRRDLIQKGHVFSSSTDTEVIIHSYEEYGVECLSRLQGMFAFALWDEKKKILFLARDRVGIKPLYYCDTGTALVFGSEIKSLLVDPDVKRDVNPQGIDRFLTYLYLPGTETLFKDIHKLAPGHYLLIKNGRVSCKQYWDLRFDNPRSCENIDETAEALWDLLKVTVRGHMISDVPVGFLLSGGVDSTALLSCAVGETNKRISTFTIGFAGAGFADERPYARLAAQRFGTDHHEITISAEQFSEFLPKYVWHMEEPVCEPPAIALYYVSKLASHHVKVVLSGEGGDEAFGGYQNYRNLLLLEKGKKAAGPLNGVLAGLLRTAARIKGFHRAQKYAPLMTASFPDYYYSRVSSPFSYFNRNKQTLYTSEFGASLSSRQPSDLTDGFFRQVENEELLNQMLYVDTKTWLPDDLLIKADKITMANSLELRVPLLDHLVLEFAARLPAEYKVKGLGTKRILKRAFQNRVPTEIIKRKKTGFPVPYDSWLRTNMRSYVRDVLCSKRALERGYFGRKAIEKLLARCDQGEPVAKEIFSLLTLELWHTQFVADCGDPIRCGGPD